MCTSFLSVPSADDPPLCVGRGRHAGCQRVPGQRGEGEGTHPSQSPPRAAQSGPYVKMRAWRSAARTGILTGPSPCRPEDSGGDGSWIKPPPSSPAPPSPPRISSFGWQDGVEQIRPRRRTWSEVVGAVAGDWPSSGGSCDDDGDQRATCAGGHRGLVTWVQQEGQ